MLNERVSRIGQTLEWISGTMRVLALDLVNSVRGLTPVNSESFSQCDEEDEKGEGHDTCEKNRNDNLCSVVAAGLDWNIELAALDSVPFCWCLSFAGAAKQPKGFL
jgi:hypothetical protein